MQRWKFNIFKPNFLAVRICFSAISVVAINPVTGKYPQLMALFSITRRPLRRSTASFPTPSTVNQRKPKFFWSWSSIFLPFFIWILQVYNSGVARSHSLASGTFTGIVTSWFPEGKDTFFNVCRNTTLSGLAFSLTVSSISCFTSAGVSLVKETIAFTFVNSGVFCI